MVLGDIFNGWRGRRQRVEALEALVFALNTFDHDTVRKLLLPDLLVIDSMGRAIHGIEDFIEADAAMRAGAGGIRLIIETAIENDGDVLVTGALSGDDPTISGPTFWRLCFEGDLISRIEITRHQSQMTVAKFHALNQKQA